MEWLAGKAGVNYEYAQVDLMSYKTGEKRDLEDNFPDIFNQPRAWQCTEGPGGLLVENQEEKHFQLVQD